MPAFEALLCICDTAYAAVSILVDRISAIINHLHVLPQAFAQVIFEMVSEDDLRKDETQSYKKVSLGSQIEFVLQNPSNKLIPHHLDRRPLRIFLLFINL